MLRLSALLLLVAGTARAAEPPHLLDAPLRAVQFADAKEGWAAGDDGVVWHTIDGGKTWERRKTGTTASLRGLHFLTPYTGWVAGRTENPDGSSSGVLLRTADGGLTWTEVAANLLPGLHGVRFIDDRNGLAFGDGTPLYPAGLFATADGGHSWRPVSGPLVPGWLASDAGTLVGRWGRTATFQDGTLTLGGPIPGGRSVRAVASSGTKTVAVGDGGLVLIRDGDAWQPMALPLPVEARSVCDFHAVAAVGEHLWLAGRPGSVVFHSADFGKTWETHRTPTTGAIHALHMLTAATGWMVGTCGTILGTIDGGHTWTIQQSGGQRAAVLCVHATAGGLPVGLLPLIGKRDGYLTAAVRVTSPDPATADTRRAADGERFAAAVRLAGGTAGEMGWAFPLPAHCDGLPDDRLMSFWNEHQGGKAGEQMLRELVLSIRTWRPEVIVTDDAGPVVRAALEEAFRRAADPAAFPEQVSALGLRPHAANKLYAVCGEAKMPLVTVPTTAFDPTLADTPKALADAAARLTGEPIRDTYRFRRLLPADPMADGEHLHAGCELARGGTARRAADPRAFTPEFVQFRQQAAEQRAAFEAFVAQAFAADVGDFEPKLKDVVAKIGELPADVAAAAAADMADRFARAGRWTVAREFHALVATRFATFPPAAGSLRWLTAYHASGEQIRRIERTEQPPVRPSTFVRLPAVTPPPEQIQQAAFAEAVNGITRVRFRSAEAERDWRLYGPEAEDTLFAVAPAAARDPATQLILNAARVRVGLTADAEQRLAAVARGLSGSSPWADAVRSEQWLLSRPAGTVPAKPLATAKKAPARPTLDGKLDEEMWKSAAVLPLTGPESLAGRYTTEARFAFDDQFVYVAVTCTHPAGEGQPKVTERKHDDDLSAFDRVELLLDLDRDYGTYYRLRVDQRGCVAEDCCGDSGWNPQWYVATTATDTDWTAELAIPASALADGPPRHEHVWAANVVRVLPGRGVQSWSGPADATPRPEGMGLLEFRAR